MTTRKPPSVSFPDWIERQIRTAEADGAFENLPGAGRPIPDIDRPQHELAWVANYLRRENIEIAGLLPPGLALAKEVEVLPERLAKERSEARARAVVEDLNARISHAHAQPQVGPPLRVKLVDVGSALEQWQTARAAIDAARSVTSAPAPNIRPRRSWLRRRRACH